ncbi:hypothetical protein [Streptomyces sp. NPDC005209]|uniref:hypothetical protein n=1 Tax=Streptomyces sp. NPDC005209 TaxID=3156715 RepID=UPI00339F767D
MRIGKSYFLVSPSWSAKTSIESARTLTITPRSNPFRALMFMTNFVDLSSVEYSGYLHRMSGAVSYSSRGHFGNFDSP